MVVTVDALQQVEADSENSVRRLTFPRETGSSKTRNFSDRLSLTARWQALRPGAERDRAMATAADWHGAPIAVDDGRSVPDDERAHEVGRLIRGTSCSRGLANGHGYTVSHLRHRSRLGRYAEERARPSTSFTRRAMTRASPSFRQSALIATLPSSTNEGST